MKIMKSFLCRIYIIKTEQNWYRLLTNGRSQEEKLAPNKDVQKVASSAIQRWITQVFGHYWKNCHLLEWLVGLLRWGHVELVQPWIWQSRRLRAIAQFLHRQLRRPETNKELIRHFYRSTRRMADFKNKPLWWLGRRQLWTKMMKVLKRMCILGQKVKRVKAIEN